MKKMERTEDKILKENLRKSADTYKAQLEVEVSDSIDHMEKLLKTTAIAVGAALIGYSIFKVFFETEESKRNNKNKDSPKAGKSDFIRPVIMAGAEVAATYFLSIARQKLKDYIQDLNETETTLNGHSSGNQ